MRAALAALVLAAAPAMAQQAAPAAGPARATVEQKEALVRRLLGDSPAVERIERSGNAQALEHFRGARERHASAVERLQAADLAGAEAQLNEAMWMVGKARQLVPDRMQREIELRVQNRAMMLAIDSLRASYRASLARVKGLPAGSPVDDPTLERISARLEEAMSFAGSEHVQETHARLRQVERDLLAALTRVLGTGTLDYRQRFETQAEEYRFELARHASYRDLLPIARNELRPGRDAATLMDRYAAQGEALAERAHKAAAKLDHAAALAAMREATSYLQSALTAAGLVLPRDAAMQEARTQP